ncbi:MAG: DUF192 domain-containing protein [Myxococcota bacterium]
MVRDISVMVCRSPWSKARGLIGRPVPGPGNGVLIENCRQVHTFFMRYAIDAVHLDRDGLVLAIHTLQPWRIGPWSLRSAKVLEMAAGEAQRLGLRPGDRPNLIDEESRASTRNSRV